MSTENEKNDRSAETRKSLQQKSCSEYMEKIDRAYKDLTMEKGIRKTIEDLEAMVDE